MSWTILLEILILLAAALLLGTIAEQVRQSAMLGYLLAGTLVGPNVLGLVGQVQHVRSIAELGVAMLLFSIGLEFSFRRLRRLGRVAFLGGTLQVVATMAAAAIVAALFGLGVRACLAVGAMVALSSTACVLRLLADRAEVDSLHGRNALGVLLLQDLAVIPLMLLLVALSAGGTVLSAALMVGRTALAAVGLVAAYVLVINVAAPRVLNLERWSRNRELPILFAIVLALGSALAAHAAGLSPAIGAFVAGVLLGQSPFATQVRADVSSLRTLLVTLFFASLGMLGDPAWALAHAHLVLGTVALVVAGKALIAWGALRLIGVSTGVAAATGLCLAQMGEFSFVLVETVGGENALVDESVFNLIVSATIATLFVTPFLVAAAPRFAGRFEKVREAAPAARATKSGSRAPAGASPARIVDAARAAGLDGERPAGDSEPSEQAEAARSMDGLGRPERVPADGSAVAAPAESAEEPHGPPRDIVIVGFGPAGQAVAQSLHALHRNRMTVIELNPRTANIAHGYGLPTHVGDATHPDVLEHAGIAGASVVAVTVPDAGAVRSVIHLCRRLAPHARIVARSRYHVRRWELELAGASEVVDEEEHVGRRLAVAARRWLRVGPSTAPPPGGDAVT